MMVATSGKTPHVFIIDDDPCALLVMRKSLHEGGYCVRAFEQPQDAIANISARDRGCVVLDPRMPTMSGLQVQQALRECGSLMPCVFVSARADIKEVVAAMKRGAVDFLAKPIMPGELLDAVKLAIQEDAKVAAKHAARVEARQRYDKLSPREREVCELLNTGLQDKQVAAELGVATNTANAQRASAFKKLGITSTFELLRLYEALGDGI